MPNIFAANCRPHNWPICERETIFGLKLGRRLPGLQKGDIILVRLSVGGNPQAGYGVKAVWYFQDATDGGSAPWSDGPYGWILKCRPILTLPKLFSEDFETSSKRSVKIPSLTAGGMCASLVRLKNIQARGYLENLMTEFPNELQRTFDYLGETKTVSGFLEDVLAFLVAQETAVERPHGRNEKTAPSGASISTPLAGQTARPAAPPSPAPFGVVGERVDLPILNYAPLNEMGVIVLFGYYLQDLGFSHLEEIRASFPDAIGMRPIGNGRFQRVRIEFEFKSSSFKNHGHIIDGCDVIVCWIHDWENCPLEVIELKTALFEDQT